MNSKVFLFKKVVQKMGKTTMIAIIAMFIVSAANAQKPKLAVMDFMAGIGLYQNDVNGLSDMLINSLFNTGKFELIERGQLCQLIGETNLQKSSLSAGQLQQLAIKGVNFLLLGTVNLTGGEYNIDIRVVDVGTGQLYSTAGVTKLSTQSYRDMMPKLATELATKLPQTVKATVTVIPAPEPPKEQEGIIVNGVKWATRNVGAKGKFADYPEDYGKYYTLEEAKTACPAGWRLPTKEEISMLLSVGKNTWTTVEGVNGRTFSRGSSSIFLPAAGTSGGSSVGTNAYYWSSNGYSYNSSDYGYYLNFNSNDVTISDSKGTNRFPVRCVCEKE